MKKLLPWLVVGVFALWVLMGFRPAPQPDFHYTEFGKLPILLNGRIQPWDSLARTSLRQMRNKDSLVEVKDPAAPWWQPSKRYTTLPATQWLLEVMAKPEKADERMLFRIDNDEVKSLLKLPADEKHFSFNQIKPYLDELNKQAERISQVQSGKRTVFEQRMNKLYGAVMLYQQLKVTLKPPARDDFAGELAEYLKLRESGVAAVRAQQAGGNYDTNAFNTMVAFVADAQQAAQFAHALIVPPLTPGQPRTDWKNIGTALMESMRDGPLPPAITHYATMVSAYRQNRPADFNQAADAYRLTIATQLAPELRKGDEEFAFNVFDPFYKATVIYVVALLGALAFWFTWSEWMRRSAFYLIVLACVLHTIGLFFRMYLERRPPVTNLYSSAVFIGWGSVLLGMFLERIHRDGIGIVVAAVTGFVTQIIALNLALGGDTMEMMRAVLDDNFWLATHVVTITLGYSAMFVAGLLAAIFIVRGAFTRSLTPATSLALSRMVYGIVCFATLFSFVGTVLGGIWADQSWGRFWGWDPKENGALLIVLWCAVILHARWGGLVHERGLMGMAIVGNIITSWSWFGVNMLGVGLHSYGFMDSAFKWLMLFVSTQVVLILVCFLPLKFWLSLRDQPAAPAGDDLGTAPPVKGTSPATT